jgi:hypothetical protein
MMQISEGHHDDSTASTANRHDSPSAKTPHASTTKKNLAKTHRTKLFPLKFEYNVSSSNIQIAQLHGQVIKALLSRFGNEIVVYDKDGDKEIKMGSFPRTKELWEENFHMMKVTNIRNDKAIIMVGHQIASSMGLSDIKQGIKDTLRSVNGFIKINDWGSDFDSRSAGFLANLRPVHHNHEGSRQNPHYRRRQLHGADLEVWPRFQIWPLELFSDWWLSWSYDRRCHSLPSLQPGGSLGRKYHRVSPTTYSVGRGRPHYSKCSWRSVSSP